jgi:putative transposase
MHSRPNGVHPGGHNNPVDAGIVEKAEEYIYSSARDYYYGKQCGLIKIEFLL